MNFYPILAALRYYWRAKTIYGTDSEFIYQFYKNVWADTRYFYAFGWLETYRQELLMNGTLLKVSDFGAGSAHLKHNQRKIKDIAQISTSPAWQGQFLFRLVNWLQPKMKLELGTCLAISTLYQHLPNTKAQFYTLEGCPNLAQFAQQKLKKYENPPQIIVGDFKNTLPELLKKVGNQRFDYVFIDGNHQYQPTIDYFEQILPHCGDDAVIVFDDINWSADMRAAWLAVCKNPRVRLSLDLNKMGLVFLNPNLSSQHFTLIPYFYKPWKIGIFR